MFSATQLMGIHDSSLRKQFSYEARFKPNSPWFCSVIWDKVKVAWSYLTVYDPMNRGTWNSPGQNTGVGSLSLLRGIVPTQGSNQGLPYCRQIIYQLSHKGSPRILEGVAYPFSSGSSQPSNQTGVSSIVGGFFTN